jgi:chromosome segregation ATPase
MSDETTNTPEQQQTSGQQVSDNQSIDSTDWESRYKGLQRKYNTLVETKGELEGQLSSLTSQREQLEREKDTLSIEKDSLLKNNQSKIDELIATLHEKDGKLSELSKVQLKVQVANELGHPELLQLVNAIPDSDDPEVIKESMKNILGFTKAQIEKREAQLTEGLSPGETTSERAPMPSTEQGWLDLIGRQSLGSDDYNKVMDAYFNWASGK